MGVEVEQGRESLEAKEESLEAKEEHVVPLVFLAPLNGYFLPQASRLKDLLPTVMGVDFSRRFLPVSHDEGPSPAFVITVGVTSSFRYLGVKNWRHLFLEESLYL